MEEMDTFSGHRQTKEVSIEQGAPGMIALLQCTRETEQAWNCMSEEAD